ncbi:NAD(P)-dependent dehydrogenase, short-chain alcohol dehydrogenase family [Devosia enhydra]|uniref:NAD(P)-dependent dehydrogenase, short-chain alcohol dehydrogenase family n=1 Tax=Devosia enhydra TaxID=665118 RepID=A0A1K2I3I2_9HYPH|nr:SDR family NAD(P)-dependent oxidoreductase [Devosia enhydra]SFZ86316.1 NAD(P)-dependent dehydrogenase, short-chain alcohol dehydrogenase family [Devosia enhydra]
MELEGRIAMVTGAGSGLGEATALKLAEEGADVVLVSRSRDELETVAAGIEAMGRLAMIADCDISDDKAMKALFSKVRERFGRLDILFANAGVNGVWAPIEELKPEEWDKTIAVNLRGTYLSIHYAVPLMKANGGAIVITSSINGTRTFTTAGASAYSTTKAGQLALGQMLALELAEHRIRVNVVCPGAIESEIDENTERRNTEDAEVPAEFPEGDIPLTKGKPGASEDVADLVAFLVSDRAKHITGTPVWIDGAQSLLV